MTSEQLRQTAESIAERLSCGHLHDATQSMGTLLELVENEQGRNDEIGCMFDEVFNNWRSL